MTLPLHQRDGLPDALRVLLTEHPRAAWEADPGFHGLVSFWLERHLMFRRLLARLRADAAQVLDNRMDPQTYQRALSQFGGMLVNQLHGHHQIEDHHYFPILRDRDPRIAAGFDLLDADHHALDGLLAGFVTQANAVLQAPGQDGLRTAAGALHSGVADLDRLIQRHLDDEEDLIVPVILKYGTAGLG